VLKFLARKQLSSVVAYVVKYVSPIDALMCLSWWVVFSLVVCCAACLVLESVGFNFIHSSSTLSFVVCEFKQFYFSSSDINL
jgi:hypothetical protein